MGQGLRICLPMQGIRVRSLVWEDPTCHETTKPMGHNYRTHVLQLLKSHARALLQGSNKRNPHGESSLPSLQIKSTCGNKDPAQPKINELTLKKKKQKKGKMSPIL